LWLVRNGAALVAFPQAMLIGQAIFMCLCYVLIGYLVRKERVAA
jgi:hypothetical protein